MLKYIEVALDVPIYHVWTYKIDISDSTRLSPGMRVKVPFGKKEMLGLITLVLDTISKEALSYTDYEIRYATKLVDNKCVLPKDLLELGYWVAKYYICPVGQVLCAIMPKAIPAKATLQPDKFYMKRTSFVNLSSEQSSIVESISNIIKRKTGGFFYLYGKTGTGKTEVFLRIVANVLEAGQSVIYLVPEIGLTHQVLLDAHRRFLNNVAVLHSGLTQIQKFRQWEKIIQSPSIIVIGARSAIFAPVNNLGLVIIDEEHDESYKSGNTPYYHARQVAMHRCIVNHIPLIMGSATPSVESYYAMQTGIIKRFDLTKRLAGGAMPTIKTVNLTMDKSLENSCIGEELCNAVKSTLQEGNQSILFINRRGFLHIYKCKTCGYVFLCHNCSIPLIYHKKENNLFCHYCGFRVALPSSCPMCGSLDMGYSGFGTEYIEEEVQKKFPMARVMRLDADSVKSAKDMEKKLEIFREGGADILTGTQMVAKGLNFEKVQLVGVVCADTALNIPDFRSSFRTYSLITQVAGRAGRYSKNGMVYVQSYNPNAIPIKTAVQMDDKAFYSYEIEQRRLLFFPPWTRMVRLVTRSKNEKSSLSAIQKIKSLLDMYVEKLQDKCKMQEKIKVSNYSECPLFMVSRNFRYHLLLRHKDIKILQEIIKKLVENLALPQKVFLEIDVDPVSIM